MISVHEEDDGLPSGCFARQFQSRLDGVRTGWPTELNFVTKPARSENQRLETFKKFTLDGCRHVEAVRDRVAFQILDQALLQTRIVVSVIERARAAEKIEILSSLFVEDFAAGCLGEDRRKVATIKPYFGFKKLKCVHDVDL